MGGRNNLDSEMRTQKFYFGTPGVDIIKLYWHKFNHSLWEAIFFTTQKNPFAFKCSLAYKSVSNFMPKIFNEMGPTAQC